MLMQDLFESFSKCFGGTDTLLECKPRDKKSLVPHNIGVDIKDNNVEGKQIRKDGTSKKTDLFPRSTNSLRETLARNKMKTQEKKCSSKKNNSRTSHQQEPKQFLTKNREISKIFRIPNSSNNSQSEIPSRSSTQETDEDSTVIPSNSPPMPLFSRFKVANGENPKNSLIVFLASGSHRSVHSSATFENRLRSRRRLKGEEK